MIIATARDAAELLEPLLADAPEDKRIVLHLDGERRLIHLDERVVTAHPAGRLPVREIIGDALGRGSAGLVVGCGRAHGDPEPGPADIEATRRLADAAASLGIRLHDRLIFAGGRCRSFRELGLL